MISNLATVTDTAQSLGASLSESSPVAMLTVAKPDLRLLFSHVRDFVVGRAGVLLDDRN